VAIAERSPQHRHLSRRIAPAVLLLLLLLTACTGLIFQPLQEHLLTPDRLGLTYRDVAIVAADGVRLHGWFLPASAPRQGSILFLHGNAQNISTHIASVAWLPATGFEVLLLDYRGYGRSAGAPSLDGLHLDFAAALETLLAMPEVDPERVVVFGQSLGGAIAITGLAGSPAKDDVRALVVEGVFTGYRALAQEKLADFWPTWLLQWPLSMTIDDRYRPVERIGELAPLPILIVQGTADQVVPAHHARALFAAAREPKELWFLPDTGHLQAFASPDNRRRLRAWLEQTLATAPRSAAAPHAARRGRPRSAPAAAAAGRRPRSAALPTHL
jgi:fermentation-respiration switch protein FrsA (DUF1100 family)